mgnify:CR=1 FL=1
MSNDKNKTNIIEISDLNKWYGDFHALKNINLQIKEGEIIVVCGPSGSGKSTLIRCVNFLEKFQEGTIVVSGTELTDDAQKIRQIRSEVSMVFQHFNLFPHLSVLENITLSPIIVLKMDPEIAKQNAVDLLKKVGLTEEQLVRFQDQLSYGVETHLVMSNMDSIHVLKVRNILNSKELENEKDFLKLSSMIFKKTKKVVLKFYLDLFYQNLYFRNRSLWSRFI